MSTSNNSTPADGTTQTTDGTEGDHQPVSDRVALALQAVTDMTPYALANAADGACDGPEAESFYTSVRDDLVELLRYAAAEDSEVATPEAMQEWALEYLASSDWEDARQEIADAAPSVYTHTRFMQLAETGAYAEDVSDYTGGEYADMETQAGWALYLVAQRLCATLTGDLETYLDETHPAHEGE